MEKEKYYTPTIEEFGINFEYQYFKSNGAGNFWLDDKITFFSELCGDGGVEEKLFNGEIRVKYLDREDIESFGFKKRLKDEWIGWKDYALDTISGEIPYFLSVTIHIPRMDDCYKIYLHRYLDEGIKLEDRINEGESELVYKGKIKNKSEFSRLLKQLSII